MIKNRYILLLSVVYLSTNTVYAQGYQSNFQGQTQIAMGSAGSALPQDAASQFYNPGSSCFLEKSSVQLGATGVKANITFQEAGSNSTYNSNSPLGTPFAIYGVYKKSESKLAAGMGIYTPFGSTVSYENDWAGRYALRSLELKSIYFQPTVSYKITDKIGLGAGLVFALGSVTLERAIPINTDSYARLSGKTNAFGFNTGIYFKATDKLAFAATYKSKVQMNISEGEATFFVPESVAANFPNGKFTSSLPLPSVVTLGSAYKASDKLHFALDINYISWKAYDSLIFDYETNTTSLLDTKSARIYENSFAFRIGAQYKLNESWKLRAGLVYGLSPVPEGRVTPETPDNNRINYSIGTHYKLSEHFQFDLSVFYTNIKRTDTNTETQLSGTYKTIAIAPGINITYQF